LKPTRAVQQSDCLVFLQHSPDFDPARGTPIAHERRPQKRGKKNSDKIATKASHNIAVIKYLCDRHNKNSNIIHAYCARRENKNYRRRVRVRCRLYVHAQTPLSRGENAREPETTDDVGIALRIHL